MNKWILIVGALFIFLLYRQNPEIVIFGAVVFIAWKILSSLGKGKNTNPDLLVQKNIQTEMHRINDGINRLVTQISFLNLANKKDAQDSLEELEELDHFRANN